MNGTVETPSFDASINLWNKRTVNDIFELFEDFKNSEPDEISDRCFTEFILEFKMAYGEFLKKIKDLPMMINCRSKCSSDSHFGWQECAELMHDFVKAINKYLKMSPYAHLISCENSFPYMLSKMRDKAKEDEMRAWTREKQARQDYISLGIDNTMEMMKNSGYFQEESIEKTY